MRRRLAFSGSLVFVLAVSAAWSVPEAQGQETPSLSVVGSSSSIGELDPGGRATHTIAVNNGGGTELRGVGLTAELSPAVRVANLVPPFDGGSCAVFSETAAGGRIAQTVHCERRSLPAGAQATATIILEVVDDAPCGPSIDRVDAFARNVAAAPGHRIAITDQIACRPRVELTVGAPRYATEGSVIQVSFIVGNGGDVALEEIVVVSAGCRRSPTGTGGGPLAPGRERRYVCTQEVGAGERHVAAGSVTASGAGEVVRATTSTEVDVIHPGLRISVSRSRARGDLVRVIYRITNTGDSTIRDITLTDNVAGPDAAIASLAPGESDTVARDVPTQAAGILDLEVRVRGLDLSGRSVTAAASTSIRTEARADDPSFPDTPFTGLDAADAATLSLLLLLIGSLALLAPHRRANG